MAEAKRFYVGNLCSDTDESDLRSLFDRFGSVDSVDVKNKRDIDGKVTATFAFVKINELADADATNVIKQCNHLKWKKQIIRVQLAQESFMDRLQKERESNKTDNRLQQRPVQNFENNKQDFSTANKEYSPLTLAKARVVDSVPSSGLRKRYYSSSDNDDDDDGTVPKAVVGGGEKLGNFDNDFWNDCEGSASKSKNGRNEFLKSGRENRGNYQDPNSIPLGSLKDRPNQNKRSSAGVVKLGSDDEDGSRSSPSKRQNLLQNETAQSKLADEKRKKYKISSNLDEETKEERLRNLKILEGIVGRSADHDDDGNKSKKIFKDPSKMRFDPSSKNSSQFFEKEVESSDNDAEEDRKKVPESKDVRVVEPPEADKNYWVSNSLSQAFSGTKSSAASETSGKKSFSFGFTDKEKSSNGFSLLSKFGKASEVESENAKSSFGQKQSRLSFQDNNPFKYELSDNEEEDEKEKPDLMVLDPMDLFAQKLKEKASATKGVSESFFFRSNDVRLDEGFYFFRPTTSVDEMRSKHEEQRPLLAQIMKKKLRRKAKKMEKMSFDLKGVNRKGGIVKKKFGFAKKGNFNRR